MTGLATQLSRQTAITIGNFDGVHAGHAALVRTCRDAVGPTGRVVAMAFDPHPASTLAPGKEPPRLTSFSRRAALLKELGADDVIQLQPTPDLLNLSPQEFIDRLVMPLAPACIVEGEDFRFGKRRAGDTHILRELGQSRGFEVRIPSAIEVSLADQLIVRASSTLTRWLIGHGRVRDAATVLGRPYVVEGQTLQGDQRGRTIGYPTANVHTDQFLPADGVYAGSITAPAGQTHLAAINVGKRPTFNGVQRRIEAFAMNSDGSAAPLPQSYGWKTQVTFDHWIREDLRFDSVGTLVEQIARDVAASLGFLRCSAT